MSSATRSVWLGYSRQSGRFGVRLDEIRRGIAILGYGANQLAPLVALASHEAGFKPLVLDMSGDVSSQISGYIDEYPCRTFSTILSGLRTTQASTPSLSLPHTPALSNYPSSRKHLSTTSR